MRCVHGLNAAVVAVLVVGCAGHEAALPVDPPAPAGAVKASPAPPPAPVPPPAPAAPTLIAGTVKRPDGTALPAVQVSFWRRDAKGELADIGEHVETMNNGAFDFPAQAWQPEVAALRFRWKRHRVHQVLDGATEQPGRDPIDVWLETPAIADWSAIAVVLDTGWSVAGLVQSTDQSFDIRRIQVMADVIGQSQHAELTGEFLIKDLPWDVERCTIRVYEQGQLLASGEASRPDRERGTREAWVEILVPEKSKP